MNDYKTIHMLRWEEIPDFPLYIDQVISLIEKSLDFLKMDEEDKIITSTMINNYVKSGIVKSPIKKKYVREHVAYFTVICLLKRVYSLDEISKLIRIQFDNSPVEKAYNAFCDVFERQLNDVASGEDLILEDDQILTLFYKTIMSVVYTVYVQKTIFHEKTLSEIKKEQKKAKKDKKKEETVSK